MQIKFYQNVPTDKIITKVRLKEKRQLYDLWVFLEKKTWRVILFEIG